MTTFVLAYIVSEEENGNINEFDDDNIALVINMLQQVMSHHRDNNEINTDVINASYISDELFGDLLLNKPNFS